MICVGLSVGLVVMKCFTADVAPATAGARFCDVAKPIYWHRKDTRGTKERVDEENAKGKKLCGWKGRR